MAEKLRTDGHEAAKNSAELETAGAEQSEKLRQDRERAAEQSRAETNVETAREKALELANEKNAEKIDDNENIKSAEKQPSKPTKAQKNKQFDRSMRIIREDMSPASRTFSKIIHNPVVEKTSDAIGKTIARPNLIIAGGLGTAILCSAVYLVAKNYGYVLSGFETIATFILGWCIGAVIEFARVGFSNQKSR